MLQNHYGDTEFPVRPRWRHLRMVRARQQQQNPGRAGRASLLRVAPAFVVGFGLIASGEVLIPHLPFPFDIDPLGYLLFITICTALALVAGVGGGGLIDRSLPVRDQLRYRELAGTPDLTELQQTLLALDAESDFAIGGWNSSLDYAPSWRCLPPRTREQYEHDRGRILFTTLPMHPVAQLRVDLDDRFGIASGRDAELFVADTLSGRGYGGRFSDVLEGPDGERMLARLGSLTGRDEWSLRELDQPTAGRDPERLLGGDVQRLITVVRLCYAADHIDADTAWGLIERAGAAAFARYADWDDYWRSVRTTIAFATDRLEQVQRFDVSMAALRISGWPATRIPFPSGAGAPFGGAPAASDPEDAAR